MVTKEKRTAILQSNYIPWKGYFDIIRSVDEFIIYDDVQYTRRDWRNRNLLKTPQGLQWISIPVKVKGMYEQLICETEIVDNKWTEKHRKSIRASYSRAKYFEKYASLLDETYFRAKELFLLSDINLLFIDTICSMLGIKTHITKSTEYLPEGKGSERILSVCIQAGANTYLTGSAGLNYLDLQSFSNAGIKVITADYSGYPEYDQLYPPFHHGVTIIDLIFNTGQDALKYMKIYR